jgi:acyl dehydratase
MLLFINDLNLWRNTPFGGFVVNGYTTLTVLPTIVPKALPKTNFSALRRDQR